MDDKEWEALLQKIQEWEQSEKSAQGAIENVRIELFNLQQAVLRELGIDKLLAWFEKKLS